MSATPVDDSVDKMYEAHIALGRKAAEVAMDVLEAANIADIPIATAVALLKFGVELERKSLLGAEADDDGDGGDPFDALAKAMGGNPPTPKEEPEVKPEEEK